jgi:hypothetical protein
MSRFYSDLLEAVELEDDELEELEEEELSDFFSVWVSEDLAASPVALFVSEEDSFFEPPFDFA